MDWIAVPAATAVHWQAVPRFTSLSDHALVSAEHRIGIVSVARNCTAAPMAELRLEDVANLRRRFATLEALFQTPLDLPMTANAPRGGTERPGAAPALHEQSPPQDREPSNAAAIPFLPLLAAYGHSMMTSHINDWWRIARRRLGVKCPIREELLAASQAIGASKLSSTLTRWAAQWTDAGTAPPSPPTEPPDGLLYMPQQYLQSVDTEVPRTQFGTAHQPRHRHRQGSVQTQAQLPRH